MLAGSRRAANPLRPIRAGERMQIYSRRVIPISRGQWNFYRTDRDGSLLLELLFFSKFLEQRKNALKIQSLRNIEIFCSKSISKEILGSNSIDRHKFFFTSCSMNQPSIEVFPIPLNSWSTENRLTALRRFSGIFHGKIAFAERWSTVPAR